VPGYRRLWGMYYALAGYGDMHRIGSDH